MVKYKVNLKFKDTEKSLNEIITEALKIELANMLSLTCNYKTFKLPLESAHYSQVKGINN